MLDQNAKTEKSQKDADYFHAKFFLHHSIKYKYCIIQYHLTVITMTDSILRLDVAKMNMLEMPAFSYCIMLSGQQTVQTDNLTTVLTFFRCY